MEQLTRRDRFVKYAVKRTRRTVNAIKTVRNLANRSSYEYTPIEAEAIVAELEGAVAKVRAAFFPPPRAQQEFDLPTAPMPAPIDDDGHGF